MFTWWVVGAFYVVAFAAFVFIRWFYRLINQPSFRGGDRGDVSTEVGYEEDPFGYLLPEASDDFDRGHTSPHANATGNIHSGPM